MDTKLVLDFLTQLKQNNNREWFQANKPWYEASRKEVENFISEMIAIISDYDPTVQSLSVKDCMFRIYRDVRFGTDKSPYKTNFGGFIARGGRKSTYPGYYFHFEPGESMIAGGVYQPQPEVLKLLRNEIYFHSDDIKEILGNSTFKKYFDRLDDFDKMKMPPKDFPSDFVDVDLLKYRSYIVSHNFMDAEVVDEKYKNQSIEIVKVLQPFMKYLNRAISNG